MIQITIFQNDKNECMGFQTSGHAEYSEPGQDIVCAAVSSTDDQYDKCS